MNESTRNEIVRRFHSGQSGRQIARELHVSRHTIRRVLGQTTRQRSEGNVPKELQKKAKRPGPSTPSPTCCKTCCAAIRN